jgi:predicted enzyme related to lactoylglutathione lyase
MTEVAGLLATTRGPEGATTAIIPRGTAYPDRTTSPFVPFSVGQVHRANRSEVALPGRCRPSHPHQGPGLARGTTVLADGPSRQRCDPDGIIRTVQAPAAGGAMSERRRIVAVILEVADLDRSTKLYREAFGLELHPGDNEVDDRWTGGRHAELSWREGAYLHFALYPAKGQPTSGAQISLAVVSIDGAHAQAVQAGARVLHNPRPEPWGRSARYEDLDGNVIELTQHS